jgi:hypothetical protein
MSYANWTGGDYVSFNIHEEEPDDLVKVFETLSLAKKELKTYLDSMDMLDHKLSIFKDSHPNFLKKLKQTVEENSKNETLMTKCLEIVQKVTTLKDLSAEETFLDERIEKKVEHRNICIICCQRKINKLCLPCSHASTCTECNKTLASNKCPVCRTEIDSSLTIFLP